MMFVYNVLCFGFQDEYKLSGHGQSRNFYKTTCGQILQPLQRCFRPHFPEIPYVPSGPGWSEPKRVYQGGKGGGGGLCLWVQFSGNPQK